MTTITVPDGVPVVRFDDAVASHLVRTIDDLAAELTWFVRGTGLWADVARQDWNGYSRRWFEDGLSSLTTVALRSRGLAEDDRAAVERARAWAVAEQQRLIDEAAAAAAAEEARLAELAAAGQ